MEICWQTWAVATPGAEGVGRLKAAKSGVATAQARDLCLWIFLHLSLAKHLNTLDLAGHRAGISGEN
jgi:hypothetical protein